MKIIDKYILKKYLTTLIFVILLLVPIAIAIDLAEKVDKFLRNANLTVWDILIDYYVNFVIFYGNTFLPLALFIAVILFTSKLAGNTEIIAIHSAKVSFKRFLKPYFIGATIVTIFTLGTNHFLVPESNKVFDEFNRKYLTNKNKKENTNNILNINLQLKTNENIYLKSYVVDKNTGYKFSYEIFDGNKLISKLMSDGLKWNEKDSTYTLTEYKKRIYLEDKDSIEHGHKLDTVFPFMPKDLVNIEFRPKEMNSIELYRYIKQSEQRGISNLNTYLVELHKRTSLPISSYILTLIAVSLASRKRRGGMGINLAIGISLMFIYVFFMKIAEVLGAGAESNSLFMVWLPNIIFGILATYLFFRNVKN